jgi:C2 domain
VRLQEVLHSPGKLSLSRPPSSRPMLVVPRLSRSSFSMTSYQQPDEREDSAMAATLPPPETRRLGLFVDVVEAKSVAAKDSTGLSDPFLVVKLRGAGGGDPLGNHGAASEWKSSVCTQTLNPKWRQLCDFPHWVQPDDTLEITAWDKDLIGSDDFLGVITLRAGDFAPQKDTEDSDTDTDTDPAASRCGVDENFPLEKGSHTDEIVSGALHLRVSYREVGTPGEECEMRDKRLLEMIQNERDNIDKQESLIELLPQGPGRDAAVLELKDARERLARLESSRTEQNQLFLKAVEREADWRSTLEPCSAAMAKVLQDSNFLESYRATGVSTSATEKSLAADLKVFKKALTSLHAFELGMGLKLAVTPLHTSKRSLFSKKISIKGGLRT